MKVRILVLGSFIFLSGCGGAIKLQGSPDVAVVNHDALPAPTDSEAAPGQLAYKIGPFDKLVVTVLGMEELNSHVVADASGRISVPLAGYVEAAGKSPGELADLIAEKLRAAHVRNPVVAINLEEVNSQTVTVDGEVTEPGNYRVVPQMTLTRAVASAKGVSKFAKLEDVVVFRTVGGQRLAALYSLKAIRNGAYEDPRIYANDTVVVGNSPSRRLFDTLIQGSALVTAPLIIALQNRRN